MNHSSINHDAMKSAYQVLSSVWCGRGFPVDPQWIAKELGVQVLEAALPENVLGGVVKDAHKVPVILINEDDTVDHKRFNCAQKIGYYVDLMMQNADCYKYVDFRMQQANFAANADQIFANYFGESLLMPEIEVRNLADEGASLAEMVKHFGVTDEAMAYRLQTLGITLPQPSESMET